MNPNSLLTELYNQAVKANDFLRKILDKISGNNSTEGGGLGVGGLLAAGSLLGMGGGGGEGSGGGTSGRVPYIKPKFPPPAPGFHHSRQMTAAGSRRWAYANPWQRIMNEMPGWTALDFNASNNAQISTYSPRAGGNFRNIRPRTVQPEVEPNIFAEVVARVIRSPADNGFVPLGRWGSWQWGSAGARARNAKRLWNETAGATIPLTGEGQLFSDKNISRAIGKAAALGVVAQQIVDIAMPGEGYVGGNMEAWKRQIATGAQGYKDLSTWGLGLGTNIISGLAKGIF